MPHCLGRIPSGPTPHLPTLHTYAARAPLPVPPDEIDWGDGLVSWPLLANDVLGDCTVAAVLHYIQAAERWRDGVGRMGTDALAEQGYRDIGWDGVGEGDGARISDVMTRWAGDGFPWLDGADRALAFARVAPQSMHAALWLFGPLIVGAQMPIRAQTQDPWITPPTMAGDDEAGSWGGHCMLLTAWHGDGSVDLVTWGGVRRASAGWVAAYVDEAWGVIHPTWLASGRSPAGWGEATLIADMATL